MVPSFVPAGIVGIEYVFIFNDTVSSNVGSYNVNTEAGNAGWGGTGPVVATITVASGGIITTFTTGTLPSGSTVAVTVQSGGVIRGAAGVGGSGGANDTTNGSTGGTGGTAMLFKCDGSVTINSGGKVGAGSGGGGGGGGSGSNDFPSGCLDLTGGNGGNGWPNQTSGAPGPLTAGDGGDGGLENSAAAAGLGGGPSSSNCGSQSTSGGAAGAQGVGIDKNGNTVTVTNNGTLFGNPAQQA